MEQKISQARKTSLQPPCGEAAGEQGSPSQPCTGGQQGKTDLERVFPGAGASRYGRKPHWTEHLINFQFGNYSHQRPVHNQGPWQKTKGPRVFHGKRKKATRSFINNTLWREGPALPLSWAYSQALGHPLSAGGTLPAYTLGHHRRGQLVKHRADASCRHVTRNSPG